LLHDDIERNHVAENDRKEINRQRRDIRRGAIRGPPRHSQALPVSSSTGSSAAAVNTKMPAAGLTANKSAENPAKVIIRPASVYKKVTPLTSMFCST
jgi:hypothetical protein